MSNQGYLKDSTRQENPWPARARKFLVAVAIALVEIANAWADGPAWLYTAAGIVGAVLVYAVPNAPKYRG